MVIWKCWSLYTSKKVELLQINALDNDGVKLCKCQNGFDSKSPDFN